MDEVLERLPEERGVVEELPEDVAVGIGGAPDRVQREQDAPRTRMLIRSWLDRFFPTPLRGRG